jgi:tRNA nucleotidyltransferase (CCA-adding enzyme)
LSEEQVVQVVKRLKLPVNLRDACYSACELWRQREKLGRASPSEVVRRLENSPPLSYCAFYLATDNDQLRNLIEKFVSEWQYVAAQINGHDLRRRGIPPGPIYRRILGKLRDAWLDGEVTNPVSEEALLEELLREEQDDS